MGLARGGVGSAHFEQPVSASSVRGTRCVGRQSRSARDFAFSRFPQCFLLDDFALRTILKTALNIPMHRSRNVFERSKRAFFCFASDFFALGAELLLSRFILKPPMHTLKFGEKRPSRKKLTNSFPFGRKLDSLYLVSITSLHFPPWLFPFASFAPLR